MGKDPAFPFYASDWLGSTKRAVMTPAERGAYIDLLSHQWGDATCSLEDDDEVLAALSGLGEGWLKCSSRILRRCFPPHPDLLGRIANPRLLELKKERVEYRLKCAKGGKKSGETRRRQAAERGSTTVEGRLKSPSPSPSPSSSKKKPPIVPLELLSYCEWWNGLHADSLVQAGVNAETPSEAVKSAWKRVEKSPELRLLIANQAGIRAALVTDNYCKGKGWFTLPKLLGGKNKEHEVIIEKLLSGGYGDDNGTTQGTVGRPGLVH